MKTPVHHIPGWAFLGLMTMLVFTFPVGNWLLTQNWPLIAIEALAIAFTTTVSLLLCYIFAFSAEYEKREDGE